MRKPNCFALYRKLIDSNELLHSLALAENIELPSNIEEILGFTRETLAEHPLMLNEDALAVTYLGLLIGVGANDSYRQIKQVVVDEAQDYYDIHFEIMKRLFPNARYTVLGDVNQTIEKREDMSLYERITEIMQKESSCLMTMNKSFRCTKEILSFSARFLDGGVPFESFNRSGEEPRVVKSADTASPDTELAELIAEAAYCKEQGYQSIAIICKDSRLAETLHDRLKSRIDGLRLVRRGDGLNTAGVFVIPITMSKGLEFDSVLIYGADAEHYRTDDDRKLLYIAGTRALHRLNLFYTGEISPLIKGLGGEEA